MQSVETFLQERAAAAAAVSLRRAKAAQVIVIVNRVLAACMRSFHRAIHTHASVKRIVTAPQIYRFATTMQQKQTYAVHKTIEY